MKAGTAAELPPWSARRLPENPQPTRPRAELLAPAPELVEGWQLSTVAAEILALLRRHGGRLPMVEVEEVLRIDRDALLDGCIELLDAQLARTSTGGAVAYVIAATSEGAP